MKMAFSVCSIKNLRRLCNVKSIMPHGCLRKPLSAAQTVRNEKLIKDENIITQKLTSLVEWYEEITGMDEVKRAQNRVLEAEEKFIAAQERRREANIAVSEIQNSLKDLYAELDNTTRGEDRYVQLITQEHKLLKEEKQLLNNFQQLEREEREYFSILSSSVKESHEKERAQAERTKYWSIIGSVIGTVIGILGSSINNSLKMKELRELVRESASTHSNISTLAPQFLTNYEKELSSIITEIKNASSTSSEDSVIVQLKELLNDLDIKVKSDSTKKLTGIDEVLGSLKKQSMLVETGFQELKSLLASQLPTVSEWSDDKIVVMPVGLEERFQKEQYNTQMLVMGSTIVILAVPFLMKYLGLS